MPAGRGAALDHLTPGEARTLLLEDFCQRLHHPLLRRARDPEPPVSVAGGVADGDADAFARGSTTPKSNEEAGVFVRLPHGNGLVVVLEIQFRRILAKARDPVPLTGIGTFDLTGFYVDDLKIHGVPFFLQPKETFSEGGRRVGFIDRCHLQALVLATLKDHIGAMRECQALLLRTDRQLCSHAPVHGCWIGSVVEIHEGWRTLHPKGPRPCWPPCH